MAAFDRRRGPGRQDTRYTGLAGTAAAELPGESADSGILQPGDLGIDEPLRGFRWPFSFHAGRVQISGGEQHLLENVRMLIATGRGECLMRPTFGCGVHQRVFDPGNATALLSRDIAEAIRNWEPRVRFIQAVIDRTRLHLGEVHVQVAVAVKGTDEILETEVTL